MVVLSTAARMFDRRGYAQTTVQDIATELGVSKPTLYNFFKGKIEILAEIFEFIIRGADAMLEEVEQIAEGKQALELFIRRSLVFGAANRNLMNVFMSAERSLPRTVRQRHGRWSRDAYHRLLHLVERAQDREDAVDPRIATFAITAFINQLGAWFSQKGNLSLDDVAAGFWQLLAEGLSPRRR